MRALSQIYSEAVSYRNSYLQITELDSGRTEQKMSIMNLMTYVMSLLIFTYETILDKHEFDISRLIADRINGSADWYVMMSKKFQYNQSTGAGDPIIFDETTLKVNYQTINENNRIITQATWQNYSEGNGILLKVCKENSNTSEVEAGTLYEALNDREMTAFVAYLNRIKFIGANIYPISIPGDIITVKCLITYDDSYITEEQAFEGVRERLIEYAKGLDYNGYIYSQSIVSAILEAEHITNVKMNVEITARAFDKASGQYGEPTTILDRYRTESGYIRFLDENGESTINTDNIKFKKNSEEQ